MGFQAEEMEKLPLTEGGKESFTVDNPSKDDLMEEKTKKHAAAVKEHAYINKYLSWVGMNKDTAGLPDVTPEQIKTIQQHHRGKLSEHFDMGNKAGIYTDDWIMGGSPDADAIGAGENSLKTSVRESLKTGVGVKLPHDNLLNEPFESVKESEPKNLQGHTYSLTPKLLKKHMDYVLGLYEQLETLEKGEIRNAAKGALMALTLAQGAHMMGDDAKQQATKEFSQNNIPTHARTVSSEETEDGVVQQGYDEAKKEAKDIIYRNDKKDFLNKYSDGLSHHVYKQTIKNTPELSDKYHYTKGLSNNTFKELVDKNTNLKDDIHGAHYDKLHKEFGGDHEKMLHAWTNGIKSTKDKFREPAGVSSVGEQPSPDMVDDSVKPEPNFTDRRMFRGSR